MSNLSTDFTNLVQEFYQKQSLVERVFDNGLLKYAQRCDIPKRQSKVAHFHKFGKFALADDVAEGVDPSSGINMTTTEVKVQMGIMSSYIDIPKEGDAILIDSIIEQSYPKFKEQLERSANRKLITSLAAGSSSGSNSYSPVKIMYANGKGSFGALAAGDSLRSKDIQRAVAYLEKNGARKINGSYMCLLSPWGREDLMVNDSEFRQLVSYMDLGVLSDNKLPMWAGAKIANQDEPFVEGAATEGTYDSTGPIYSAYVFGADAFGVTQLMGQTGLQPNFKVQDVTKTGALMSIGWRTYYANVVLDPTYCVQIKHYASNASSS